MIHDGTRYDSSCCFNFSWDLDRLMRHTRGVPSWSVHDFRWYNWEFPQNTFPFWRHYPDGIRPQLMASAAGTVVTKTEDKSWTIRLKNKQVDDSPIPACLGNDIHLQLQQSLIFKVYNRAALFFVLYKRLKH